MSIVRCLNVCLNFDKKFILTFGTLIEFWRNFVGLKSFVKSLKFNKYHEKVWTKESAYNLIPIYIPVSNVQVHFTCLSNFISMFIKKTTWSFLIFFKLESKDLKNGAIPCLRYKTTLRFDFLHSCMVRKQTSGFW